MSLLPTRPRSTFLRQRQPKDLKVQAHLIQVGKETSFWCWKTIPALKIAQMAKTSMLMSRFDKDRPNKVLIAKAIKKAQS